MSKTFGEKQPGQILRSDASHPFFSQTNLVQRNVQQPNTGTTAQGGSTGGGNAAQAISGAVDSAVSAAAGVAAATSCPIQSTGTLSKVSWGETSGLYPSSKDKYDPSKWDAQKTCELLKARRAVHDVSKRGQKTHESSPKASDKIEQMLKKYHYVENFPAADPEIADAEVKWFYLSNKKSSPAQHPSLGSKANSIVKTYGAFYNNGGGDVGSGDTYIHFYKLDTASTSDTPAKK